MLIVYIIGTTASGKTNLSLNLGIDNYEIISCDSMQLYKEANIMTAKATPQEQQKVKHHGIDILELDQEGFNRQHWREITLQKIEELHSKGIIPVLVGGTHYYIESILFNQQEPIEERNLLAQIDLNGKTPYDYLNEIDPQAAQKFHPNDTRRIMNSIKYFLQSGNLPSQQQDHFSENCTLRNNNFLILWPKWKKNENLKEKVQERIHEMLEQGGTQEIINIFEKLSNKQIQLGGVLQSIGYRQFQEAYNYYKENQLQFPELDQTFNELMKKGEEQLILDTMAYTKQQLKWIKNRILCNSRIEIIANRLFLLEFENTQDFKQRIIPQAQNLYKLFNQLQDGQTLQDNKFKISNYEIKDIELISPKMIEYFKQNQIKKQRSNWKKTNCQICNKIMNGPFEEQQHYKSRFHKINVEKQKQLEIQQKKQKID